MIRVWKIIFMLCLCFTSTFGFLDGSYGEIRSVRHSNLALFARMCPEVSLRARPGREIAIVATG